MGNGWNLLKSINLEGKTEGKYDIGRETCNNKLEEKKWWEKYKVCSKVYVKSGERALYSTQVKSIKLVKERVTSIELALKGLKTKKNTKGVKI